MTQLLARARQHASPAIGLIFGGLWATLSALSLAPKYRPLAWALAFLITLGLLSRLWSTSSTQSSQRALFGTRSYLFSIVAEVAALFLMSATFRRFGLSSYVLSATGFIVGLHFIGLWRANGSRRFLSISAGMCLVSLLSALLPSSWKMFNLRDAFLGLGNALVLWTAALGRE